MKKFIVIIMVIIAIMVAKSVNAIGEDFFVEFSPENPGPNETVFTKTNSYSFDINRADISWILNGKTALKGKGEKNFSFKTGDIGSKTSLSVSIINENGISATKNFVFKIADADLIWEALTYTPSNYKGRALASSGSIIKIVAIPHFAEAASKLIYEWNLDNKNKPNSSGAGKQTFTFKSADLFESNVVKVKVSNYDRSTVVEKRVNINIISPKIIFYEESPLFGTKYNTALSNNLKLNSGEITLRAEPYYFSNYKSLSFEWLMNIKKIIPDDFLNILSLRVGEGGSGSSDIKLKVNNPINILQFGDNNLRIEY